MKHRSFPNYVNYPKPELRFLIITSKVSLNLPPPPPPPPFNLPINFFRVALPPIVGDNRCHPREIKPRIKRSINLHARSWEPALRH